MIITPQIVGLVYDIERCRTKASIGDIDSLMKQLIVALHESCNKPENRQRYETYHTRDSHTLGRYPCDEDGYAIAYDPLEDEIGFRHTRSTYNMVVGRGVVTSDSMNTVIEHIHMIVDELSHGCCDIENPATYGLMPTDTAGQSIISRGFFELYHDNCLLALRQAVRLYIHHVVIRGRVDLWTTFDRCGVKLPSYGVESQGLGLHVDQNPTVHPFFTTTQGILSLIDCPKERGTFLAVPGSVGYFSQYIPSVENTGEYVQLPTNTEFDAVMREHAQAIPLRAGDIVTRDSRMTHANTDNLSDKVRYVAMISAGPVQSDPENYTIRQDASTTGEGSNVRDALMHATHRSRFDVGLHQQRRQSEEFTLLGELLYGRKTYDEII